jgi:meso-butanediol dehydrogenase / (S,S)-butanediol dehydrogenase / diacetyl reductase
MTSSNPSRVVFVTGAASGIGAATVSAFLERGDTVVAADISEKSLDRLAADLANGRLHTLVVDVTDAAAVDSAIATVVAEHGGLDTVIANAGIAAPGAVTELSDESWRAVMSLDVDGVFHVARAALPHLEARGGSIVSTASISGFGGDTRMAVYNAAKGAVINLTRSMAVDYGPRGVRVNAVAPGPTATPALLAVLAAAPDVAAEYAARIPLGRVAEPHEIAEGMVFLATASYINGVILPIDGGLSAWTGQPDLRL